MRLLRLLSLFILVQVAFISCITAPRGMTSSTTPVAGREYQVLGKAEGSAGSLSSVHLVLRQFGWTINRPDIDEAIQNALKAKNGDALINVRWYEKNYYFILFTYTSVVVTGNVIKFQE